MTSLVGGQGAGVEVNRAREEEWVEITQHPCCQSSVHKKLTYICQSVIRISVSHSSDDLCATLFVL